MNAIHGHDAALAAFHAARGGRLHHAWLLAGPRGIGKASFAHAAALSLLAEGAGHAAVDPTLAVPDGSPTASLIDAGSHPDLMLLERLWREKTSDHARSITVDQVRSLQRLFATTATYSERRVVIVDAADDLQKEGANALLKNLEEPPPGAIFLLVSHAPAALLPTIRSRCRMLRFGSLDDTAMGQALGAALPDADDAEIAALVRTGGGAPGRAIRHAGLDVAGLDAAMAALVARGDPRNVGRVALAQALGLKAAQPRYEAFLRRVPSHIAGVARGRRGSALGEAITLWENARALADSAVPLSLDPQATVFELGGMLAALGPKPEPIRGPRR